MEKLLERLQELLQLEFVYEADGTLIDDHDHAMDVPIEPGQITLPSGHRTVLVELARRGDVGGLREEAEKLAQSDARYTRFAETIKTLAERFQVNQIRRILKATREEP